MEVRGNSTGYKNVLEIPEEYIFGFVDKVNDTFDIVDPALVESRRADMEKLLARKPFVISQSLFE